jgi:hypothetical protein
MLRQTRLRALDAFGRTGEPSLLGSRFCDSFRDGSVPASAGGCGHHKHAAIQDAASAADWVAVPWRLAMCTSVSAGGRGTQRLRLARAEGCTKQVPSGASGKAETEQAGNHKRCNGRSDAVRLLTRGIRRGV